MQHVWLQSADALSKKSLLLLTLKILRPALCIYHIALKIRTDGGHAQVRELGSIGIFSFFFYCNFVKRGPLATKFCTHSAIDNLN